MLTWARGLCKHTLALWTGLLPSPSSSLYWPASLTVPDARVTPSDVLPQSSGGPRLRDGAHGDQVPSSDRVPSQRSSQASASRPLYQCSPSKRSNIRCSGAPAAA